MHIDAVVVGAGHAGLATSQRLATAGIEHVVLERDVVGASWRRQRWDSFALNTPAWMNRLPGEEPADLGVPLDGFHSASAFADRLVAYAARWRLPVREGVAVTRLEPAGELYRIRVEGTMEGEVLARGVVVASGIQNVPVVPPIAAELPDSVVHLHSLAYRSAAALPPGAVLVVGSGQTGGQVAEDLLGAGRRVYLSPSRVPRLPRRHRGRDILEWLVPAGFYEVRSEQVQDPAVFGLRQPIISGVGRYGHSLSIQWLAARGATLVGRIRSVTGTTMWLDDGLAELIRFGDATSADGRRLVDEAIEASGATLPPLEDDSADAAHPDPASVRSPDRLDLADVGVATVIWATGVGGDFSWLPAAVLDDAGRVAHVGGRTASPGLHVVGLPWLTRRASGIIHGAGVDAELIATDVAARLGARSPAG